ncbi:hypothetical protein SapgrDRAFT_1558 [Saprospira grandis DSM 2844]|uniref:Uncharacterized protein n=2 Tax=Saprospira TaxID=1007 RepID=J0P0G6_9BACT|nr:hypothetical protein SapgrDRAFT_1558 [Saprospira grandis DSM 2844]
MKNEKEQFTHFVWMGYYHEALALAKNWSLEKMMIAIVEHMEEDEMNKSDIIYYGYFVHLLISWPVEKHLAVHEAVSYLLYDEMNTIIEGTKMMAIHHLREALALAPGKEENKLRLKKLLANVT